MTIVLQTDRLTLRRFADDDAGDLLRMESDPEMLRYVGRGPLADADAYRQHIRAKFLPYYDRPGGHGPWAIIETASGEIIGGCSLKPGPDARDAAAMGFGPDDVEIGYGLRTASWGRGYATELARALARKAFAELHALALVASVSAANAASIRVLEKAGLERVGGPISLPGDEHPSFKYALSKQRFDAQVLARAKGA